LGTLIKPNDFQREVGSLWDYGSVDEFCQEEALPGFVDIAEIKIACPHVQEIFGFSSAGSLDRNSFFDLLDGIGELKVKVGVLSSSKVLVGQLGFMDSFPGLTRVRAVP
jgi:hypothetical protein